jgi:hypothetical protein
MTPRYNALTLVFGFVLFTGFVTAQPTPVRIMPLGDSITHGTPVAGGYRLPLYHMLTNASYSTITTCSASASATDRPATPTGPSPTTRNRTTTADSTCLCCARAAPPT